MKVLKSSHSPPTFKDKMYLFSLHSASLKKFKFRRFRLLRFFGCMEEKQLDISLDFNYVIGPIQFGYNLTSTICG